MLILKGKWTFQCVVSLLLAPNFLDPTQGSALCLKKSVLGREEEDAKAFHGMALLFPNCSPYCSPFERGRIFFEKHLGNIIVRLF